VPAIQRKDCGYRFSLGKVYQASICQIHILIMVRIQNLGDRWRVVAREREQDKVPTVDLGEQTLARRRRFAEQVDRFRYYWPTRVLRRR
jgi:hypothetical protein